MGNSQLQNPINLSLIFLIMSCVNLSSLASPKDQITSCLTLNSIKNFTIFPTTKNASETYYKTLNFSIQNLRFTNPSTPKPLAIILPETLEQVKNAVTCSIKGFWKIIVRCGGHSYEGTSSFSDDGSVIPFVIIDMMNLNRVTVNLETETAWVEGGATLGETYYTIAKVSNSSYGFSAGSCPTVGVGGHISGGGFGLLSRKYGLAADNVIDALLIDANGQLLDRKGMGEDVFWAIRGGGGGIWGIVYAWKIKLLKVPKIVTSFIVSRSGTKDYMTKLVSKWQKVAPNLEDEFYLSCFVGAGLPEMKGNVGISSTFKGFYLGSKKRALNMLGRLFPELGIEEKDCKEMSWIDSIVFFSGLSKGSTISDLKNRYLEEKVYFKAKSDYVRSPISNLGFSVLFDLLEKESKGYVILDPYGGIMKKICSDSIAFPHRKGNLFTVQYLVEWKKEDINKKKDEYVAWIRRLYDSMTPFVSFGPRAAYINYMDFDLGVMEFIDTKIPNNNVVEVARIWGEKYFLNNYDRLVRAKTIIDPNNVFSNKQGIPPMPLEEGVIAQSSF